jgi:anti-sigma B factor antagonist
VERSSGAAPPLTMGASGGPQESQTLTVSLESAEDDCPILILAGELDLSTIPRLEKPLLTQLGSNAAVIFDLTRVSFIDSSGIGLLIKAFRAGGGALYTVIAEGSQVDRVLNLAGVNRVLPLFTDREQAIAALDGRAGD